MAGRAGSFAGLPSTNACPAGTRLERFRRGASPDAKAWPDGKNPIRRGPLYTILVVDDSRNILDFCRRELAKCGYRIVLAHDGQEALDLCDAAPPDVVVLDIHMPGLDGLGTMRQLSARHTTIPVIFHTAHRDDLACDYRDWPVLACVEKTQDLSELKSAIVDALTHVEEGRKRS
jgi:CheY-like chemotaxis protein